MERSEGVSFLRNCVSVSRAGRMARPAENVKKMSRSIVPILVGGNPCFKTFDDVVQRSKVDVLSLRFFQRRVRSVVQILRALSDRWVRGVFSLIPRV